MPITVHVKSIQRDVLQKILDHYNKNKPDGEYPLEILNRTEGGFKIQLPKIIVNKLSESNILHDANSEIRQLRWSRGQLVSGCYIGFTQEQELLLYNALVDALGKANVSM
jgi:hypothetical protein